MRVRRSFRDISLFASLTLPRGGAGEPEGTELILKIP